MKKILLTLSLLFVPLVHAGVDISSTVDRMWVHKDGNLHFKMTNARFDEYCKPGWFGFNLFIPVSDKNYAYYYGLVTTALTKNLRLYIANISKFDGSTSCDLTQTGYGMVLLKS